MHENFLKIVSVSQHLLQMLLMRLTSSANVCRLADALAPLALFMIVTACSQWDRNTSRHVSGSVPLFGRCTTDGRGDSVFDDDDDEGGRP